MQRLAEVLLQGLVIDWDKDATGMVPRGSEVKQKLKRGTLDHGFSWNRQSEFGDRD